MNTAIKLAYPIEEGFEMLGVSRTRGYKLISAGTLKTYKDGKRRFCSHAALVACQRSMEKSATEGRKVA
ncbi:MAG: hypothetical protein KIS84_08175 [Dokdonella sp.]|nr:hypothetical protein [Dokdonella sp.]